MEKSPIFMSFNSMSNCVAEVEYFSYSTFFQISLKMKSSAYLNNYNFIFNWFPHDFKQQLMVFH
jgi:hypothetical protein